MTFRGTKERDDALEVIREMTKAEIIEWLSGEIGFLLRPPRKSHLLFGRYRAAANAADERRSRNTLADGVAKKIDELRAKLGQAKDHKEFLKISRDLEPYHKALKKWLAENEEIRKDEKRADSLYSAYMKQSEEERKG